jgi:hypothetical protein
MSDQADDCTSGVMNGLSFSQPNYMDDLRFIANVAYEGRVYIAPPTLFLYCAEKPYSYLVLNPTDDSTITLLLEILTIVIKGKEMLADKQRRQLYPWIYSDFSGPDGCSTSETCNIYRAKLARFVHGYALAELIHKVGEDHWRVTTTLDLCPECVKHAKKIFVEESDTFWSELPASFGLSSWDWLQRRME